MVCALVAHAAVYRSLLPGDGPHAYFGWYVPLVAVASIVSLAAVVAGGFGRGRRVGRLIRFCLPARTTTFSAGTTAALASGGLVFLMVQESLERSVDAGVLTLASFDASMWPILLVVLILAAAAVLAAGRTAVVLSDRAVAERRTWVGMARVISRIGAGRDVVRLSALLGMHAGLRAPPLVA
jgi:hypothetical protein